MPEFAIEEARKYFKLVGLKSGLSIEEIRLLFDVLSTNFEIVPLEDFSEGFTEARNAMQKFDENDAPFIALALCIECDGVWSNDKDLKKQDLVKVWNTEEILKIAH